MKKTVRIIAVALVAVMLCFCLASCGKTLSGEYYAGDKDITKTYTVYTFRGSSVKVEDYLLGNKISDSSFEGKYSIDGDEITFIYEDNKGNEQTITKTFEELDDGSIKIGVITYTKDEK